MARKRLPEIQAFRSTLAEWHDTINQRDAAELNGEFLRDVLLSLFEGMLSLDEKILHFGQNEWKVGDTMMAMQDELNMMRYKMIQFQEWAKIFNPADTSHPLHSASVNSVPTQPAAETSSAAPDPTSE